MYFIQFKNDICVSKCNVPNEGYVLQNYEREITEEEYNTIPIPCKIVNSEYIPYEFPKTEDEPEQETEPTTEELLNILLGVSE